jgi:hypothetical protein
LPSLAADKMTMLPTIYEFLQCRMKTQASVSHQGGAEHLGPVVGKIPENPLVTSCPANSERTKRSGKGVC